MSVKQGFTHRPHIQDEYSSAQNTSITPAKVSVFIMMILIGMCLYNDDNDRYVSL